MTGLQTDIGDFGEVEGGALGHSVERGQGFAFMGLEQQVIAERLAVGSQVDQ